MRARSEQPPAGPEKFTNGSGLNMCKQNFEFFKISGPCNFFVEISTFHARHSRQLFGFATHLFAAFHRPMAPPKRIRLAKNSGCRKYCVHFKKIEVEHPKNTITMSGNRSQNHPRRGITLQAKRSTSHVGERAASSPRQGRKNSQTAQDSPCASKISNFQDFWTMQIFR